jgi:hypothetical protein
MSGAGVTDHNKELKYLHHLLKALPENIPVGYVHNFLAQVPSQEKVVDSDCLKTVVSWLSAISQTVL